jgi:hypothetical protein
MWKFLTSSGPAGTRVPSPGGQYVAVLGPPQEVWGSYLAGLAVWAAARPPQLLYHRAGYAAHALGGRPTDQPTFIYWSPDGSWLAFYEFKRQQAYEVVFLNLPATQAYRVPASDELLQQLPGLLQNSARLPAFLASAKAGPLVADSAPAELRLG